MRLITDEHRAAVFDEYVESIEDDLPLARSGDTTAMYRLYENFGLLARLYDVPATADPALMWLLRSAEQGYPKALSALGHIYKNGDKLFGIERDLEQAANYFKSAWEKGDSTANFYYTDIIECELAQKKAPDC